MKLIGRIVGAVWAIVILGFMAVSFYADSGHPLPDAFVRYRHELEHALRWFMASGLFFPLFITMWFAGAWQLGKDSGWHRLAITYGIARGSSQDEAHFMFGSGRVGKVAYNNTLKVATTRSQLIIRLQFLFRFRCPDLFIPWSEIKSIRLQPTTLADSAPGFLKWIGKNLSRGTYARIELSKFPDQILIIPWNDTMKTPSFVEMHSEA
jgi:hypothetical protein